MPEKMKEEVEVDLGRELDEHSQLDEHRELDEHNARLAKFNLKLADRLAKCHGDIMTIGLVMTTCGTGILGYLSGGRVMSIKDITTVAWAIGGLGYCVRVAISK